MIFPPMHANGGPLTSGSDDDYDVDAEMARFLADIDAGVEPIPDPAEPVPAVVIVPGGASCIDPRTLASLYGPDGLGALAQGEAAGSWLRSW